MIPYDFQGITLMQLNVFMKCVELMNFTRAAKELNITPGMVSKKITGLENALGFPLFRREKNRVFLTVAGETLFTTWRPLLEAFVRQAEELRRWEAETPALVFGLSEETNIERYFVPLLRSFTAEEDVAFRIITRPFFDLLEDLLTGRTDVAFASEFMEPAVAETGVLECFMAAPSPLYAGFSETNPLSARKTVRVEELRKLHFLLFENDALCAKQHTNMVMELCHKHGFEPKIRRVNDKENRYLHLCLDDYCVLITDKFYFAFQSNALEFRALEGTESGLIMIYKKSLPPYVKRFVTYAKTFFRELK